MRWVTLHPPELHSEVARVSKGIRFAEMKP
jgi:hypothetical protein